MKNSAETRGRLIAHLKQALGLADELEDGTTEYPIERALDEAWAHQFRFVAE
jgi:hypothetical protein